MNPLPRPNAVLFDWDSTLVDNWGGIARAMAITFAAYGLEPWSEDECRANAKLSMRERFPTLFGDRWEDASKLFYDSFAEIHLQTLKPLPGSVELLQALAEAGVPAGVVSNKTGMYLRAEAAHLGWDGYFHKLVGATDAPRDKPAPDPIHLALDGTGVPAGPRVWFVGDSAVDLECAHGAGCTPILLHPDNPPPEDMTAFPPAAHLFGCNALLEVLGG
ncbi:MAG: HAD family hydrolase [Alphaproteobacteria bacterium]|nr:HAD family hydrolase [Alphaproteobacteria bacterium]